MERVTSRAGALGNNGSSARRRRNPFCAIAIGVIRRSIGVVRAEGPPILLQLLAARTAVEVGGMVIGEVDA